MDIKWYTKIFIRYPFTYIHFIKSKRVLRNSRQEKYTIIKMSNIKRSFTLQLSVGECRLLVSLQSRWSWFCICHPSPAKEWSPSAGAPRLWLLRDQEVLCQQSIKLPLDGGGGCILVIMYETCRNFLPDSHRRLQAKNRTKTSQVKAPFAVTPIKNRIFVIALKRLFILSSPSAWCHAKTHP